MNAEPATTTEAGRAGLARSSVAVATGTLLSRCTGLLRVVALAWALGGGTLADAYNLANTAPNILYELLIGGVLTATLLPIFVRQMHEHNDRSTAAVFTISLTVVAAFTVVALVCTPLIARLFAIGSSGAERDAQVRVLTILILCFLPQIFFYALTALSSALLNAHRRFVAAAYAPVCNNIVVIGVLVAFAARTTHNRSSWTDVARIRDDVGLLLLLGLGTTAGIVTMALVLVPAVRATRVHLRPVFAWRDAGVRQMVRLSGWTFGYVATNQIAQLFVLVLAKTGTKGGVTSYVYAFTFYVLPHSLLAVSIMTTMTPELARRASAADMPGMRRDFALGLRYLVVLTLPASVLFAVLAQPMLGVLTIGKFSVHNAHVTGDTLQLFAVSLVAFSTYLYALRGFYALADTRTPFLLNLAENTLNVVLAIALWGPLGVQGLALAWSISYFVAAAAALVVLKSRIGAGIGAGITGATTRAAAGSLVLAIVAGALAGAIGNATARRALAATAVAAAAGAAGYLLVLALTRSEELGAIAAMLRRRGKSAADVSP